MRSIAKLKEQARRHESNEEWDRAIRIYEQVLDRTEEHAQPDLQLYNRVGDIYLRLGRKDHAVRYYERAADRYAEARLYNNAIALCNKVLRYDKNHAEIYRKLARYSDVQGFVVDARRYFMTYAEARLEAGRSSEVLDALAEYNRLPHDPETHESLAEHLEDSGARAEAVTVLRRAYALRSGAEDTDRAHAVGSRLLELDPTVDLDQVVVEEGLHPTSASSGAQGADSYGGIDLQSVAEAAGLTVDGGSVDETFAGDEEIEPLPLLEPFESSDGTTLEREVPEGESLTHQTTENVPQTLDELTSNREHDDLEGTIEIDRIDAYEPTVEPEGTDPATLPDTLDLEGMTPGLDDSAVTEPDPSSADTTDSILDPEDVLIDLEEIASGQESESPESGEPDAPEADRYVDLASMLLSDDTDDAVGGPKQEEADGDDDLEALLEPYRKHLVPHGAEDPTSRYDLGLAFKEMGLIDEAITEFLAALDADPTQLKVYEELGECMMRNADYELAARILERALDISPVEGSDVIGVHYHLGRCNEELGRRDAARDAYEHVAKIDASFQDVADRLAGL